MRFEGWEKLLQQHIKTAKDITFEWGKHDCALWCADWVNIATGVDHASKWRGLYTTRIELDVVLAKLGYDSVDAIADELAPSMHQAFAQRGDIVKHPIYDSLGICDGILTVFLTEKGIIKVRTVDCVKAWKVR